MSGQVWRVFTYELTRNLRRPGFLFTTFGVPVLLFVAFTLITRISGANGIDASNPETIEELTEQFDFTDVPNAGFVDTLGIFNQAELPENWTRYPDDAEARAALEAGTDELYYIIEPDFADTGAVTTVLPEFQFNRLINDNLGQLVRGYFAQGIDPEITARLLNPSSYQETNLSLTTIEDGAVNEDVSFLIVYAFAITLFTTLFMTNGYLMQTLIEEKETRLIEVLVSAVRPLDLLTGKILALGLLGLIQVAVWVGAMIVLTTLAGGQQLSQGVSLITTLAQIQIPLNLLPILLIYFVLSYLLFAGLYSAVSAISNSMREGPQYLVIFILPVTIPLYFLPIIATSPDTPFVVLMSIFPFTAPLTMTSRLVVSDVPATELIASIALLALTVMVAIWVASRVFRAGVLLAGNVPKLKDIPMLLRG